MKKENINNYYTDEDLINFEKLKNFKEFKVNKLNNNQNKSHLVRYAVSDNRNFNPPTFTTSANPVFSSS